MANPPDIRRLDAALALLRKPSAGPPVANRSLYVAGLLALGWRVKKETPSYWVLSKEHRTCHVYDEAIWMRLDPAKGFSRLPPKAVRNIVLAGQADEVP